MTIEIRILYADCSVRPLIIGTRELLYKSLLDIFAKLKKEHPTICAIRTDIHGYTWVGLATVEHMAIIADMEQRGINW